MFGIITVSFAEASIAAVIAIIFVGLIIFVAYKAILEKVKSWRKK